MLEGSVTVLELSLTALQIQYRIKTRDLRARAVRPNEAVLGKNAGVVLC
jgi:hypothetical protein